MSPFSDNYLYFCSRLSDYYEKSVTMDNGSHPCEWLRLISIPSNDNWANS